MKRNNHGFSLVEVVAAIAILGILVGPVCTSLVFGLRLNETTEAKLQAQLAVSSAVETLMAEGIDPDSIDDENGYSSAQLENEPIEITVKAITKQGTMQMGDVSYPVELPLHYYEVKVDSTESDISITTHIREAVAEP